jgi:predicted amidophosphoribosyltransferase
LAAIVYDGTARALLLRAKVRGRREILADLAAQLAIRIEVSGWVDRRAGQPLEVVPVPSHPWPSLRRGFDPAREMASSIGRRLGVPVRPRALKRALLAFRPLKTMHAIGRQREASRAFAAREVFRGGSVILVDDVMTTGATLVACSAALRRAGAGEILVAVWARTPLLGAATVPFADRLGHRI